MSSPCFRLLSGTGTPACAGLHEAAGAAGGAKGLLPFLVWEQRESTMRRYSAHQTKAPQVTPYLDSPKCIMLKDLHRYKTAVNGWPNPAIRKALAGV